MATLMLDTAVRLDVDFDFDLYTDPYVLILTLMRAPMPTPRPMSMRISTPPPPHPPTHSRCGPPSRRGTIGPRQIAANSTPPPSGRPGRGARLIEEARGAAELVVVGVAQPQHLCVCGGGGEWGGVDAAGRRHRRAHSVCVCVCVRACVRVRARASANSRPFGPPALTHPHLHPPPSHSTFLPSPSLTLSRRRCRRRRRRIPPPPQSPACGGGDTGPAWRPARSGCPVPAAMASPPPPARAHRRGCLRALR